MHEWNSSSPRPSPRVLLVGWRTRAHSRWDQRLPHCFVRTHHVALRSPKGHRRAPSATDSCAPVGGPSAGDTWTNDWFLEVLIYLCELWWSLQMCLPGIHPYTHTLRHAGNLKILCRPETLPTKLPSCLNILCLYFHKSQLLMEGEAQKPEHSSPGPSPEALKSNFLTWICISKLGKRLQNQICKVSPKILRIAKAHWSDGDRLERNGIWDAESRIMLVYLILVFLHSISYTEHPVRVWRQGHWNDSCIHTSLQWVFAWIE